MQSMQLAFRLLAYHVCTCISTDARRVGVGSSRLMTSSCVGCKRLANATDSASYLRGPVRLRDELRPLRSLLLLFGMTPRAPHASTAAMLAKPFGVQRRFSRPTSFRHTSAQRLTRMASKKDAHIIFQPGSLGISYVGDRVMGVNAGSQAEKAGVQIGWRMKTVNGKKCGEAERRAQLLASSRGGSTPYHITFDTEIASEVKEQRQTRSEPVMVEGEVCNVAVTHVFADFDSLAAAVALAKYWRITRPEHPTFVCIPASSNPVVEHYLKRHKSLIPVRGFQTFRSENIRAMGILDTSESSRIGKAAEWLSHADHIELFDHHSDGLAEEGAPSDIKFDAFNSAAVGSVTTLLVEKLRELHDEQRRNASSYRDILTLNAAELTLFALGIHSDTLNLVAPSTTPRDVQALAWLMDLGASQAAIAEFAQARPSESHGEYLAEALNKTVITEHEGLRIGMVHGKFGRGGAYVAYDVLSKLSLDVLLFGAVSISRSNKAAVSVIGRCSRRAPVDLSVIMKKRRGGGHAHAAAATLQLGAISDAEALEDIVTEKMDELLNEVHLQIPKQAIARDIMSKDVVTLPVSTTMLEAIKFMDETDIVSIPVLDDEHKLKGILKKSKVVEALRSKHAEKKVTSALSMAHSIHADATLSEIEHTLDTGSTRLPVVDDDNVLIGMVTGTDVLDHRHLYFDMHDWHKGFSRHNKEHQNI